MRIEVAKGDITEQTTDAIVNAANAELTNGSGVNGAIHRAAGPELAEALGEIGSCHTGNAVITPGFNLPCQYIIHAVGPIWHGGSIGEEALLAGCYRSSLNLAAQYGLKSVSFPSISTGIFGYPPHLATAVAVKTIGNHAQLELVRLVAFDDHMYKLLSAEVVRQRR